MLRVVVLVSGGGTNLQAIIDAIAAGKVTNAQIVGVISNNKTVKSLERARNAGIPAVCVSTKDYESREVFNGEGIYPGSDRAGRLPGEDPGGYGA